MGFWGLGIVVAPMLGPVIGGWLTDSYSWRWVFYINVPVGILAMVLTSMFVFDPSYIRRKAQSIDYWGMGMLALGIAALQIMLDKGQEEDWFSSRFIVTLAILAFMGLLAFIIREITAEHPIVDLSVCRNRTYATGLFLMTVLGFVLYGSTVVVPLLLQTVLGYPPLAAGIAMLPRGLGSFIAMPIVGAMMSRVEPRRLLGIGIVGSVIALWQLSDLNLEAGYWNFFWPLILQGVTLGLIFIPLTTITNDPIPKEKMGNATSLFNLMRNLGASIGIATSTTILARHQQVHFSTLGAHVNPFNGATQQMIDRMRAAMMARGSDPITATRQAYAAVFRIVQKQATMMAFNDVFWVLTIIFMLMFPLIFLMRKPKHQPGTAAMH